LDILLPAAAQIVLAKIISHDVDDVWLFLALRAKRDGRDAGNDDAKNQRNSSHGGYPPHQSNPKLTSPKGRPLPPWQTLYHAATRPQTKRRPRADLTVGRGRRIINPLFESQ
jgi:hypothetical protein